MSATRGLLLAAGLGVVVFVAIRALPSSDGAAPRAAPSSAPEGKASVRAPAIAPMNESAASGEPAIAATPVDPREKLAKALANPGGETVPPDKVVAMIESGLVSTGASSEPWTRDADRAFTGLQAEMKSVVRDERFKISSPRCFAAGCIVTVDYPPGTDVVALGQTMVTTKAIMAWPGGKLASPAVDGSGALANRWVLLRPDHL